MEDQTSRAPKISSTRLPERRLGQKVEQKEKQGEKVSVKNSPTKEETKPSETKKDPGKRGCSDRANSSSLPKPEKPSCLKFTKGEKNEVMNQPL